MTPSGVALTSSPLTEALAEGLQRQAAQRIEMRLNGLRTDEVIRPHRWRPFRRSGFEAGLRTAHEEVQKILTAHGIWHPAQGPRP